MKELSIEEKARRYDEAIERAKYYQKENGSAVISAIFPELKDDERIRKWCLNLIKATCDYDSPTSRKEVDDAIDWLEQKGSQNLGVITEEELSQAQKDAFNNVLDKLEYSCENPTFDDGWNEAIWYLKKRNALRLGKKMA